MIVHTDIGDIYYSFRHTQLSEPIYAVGNKLQKAVTECNLAVGDRWVNSKAWCSVEDSFCKETGRKIALTRALEQAELPKEIRRTVWAHYFNSKIPKASPPRVGWNTLDPMLIFLREY